MSANEMINVKRMMASGLKSITVKYSGSGDSGAFDSVDSEPELQFSELQREIVYSVAQEILHRENVGDWWNNEGGQGTIVFTIDDGRLVYHLDSGINYEDDNHSEASGTLTDESIKPIIRRLIEQDKDGTIVFEYSGREGSKDSYYFYGKDSITESVYEALDIILERHYPDWAEGDEGSEGRIMFRLDGNEIAYNIEHSECHTGCQTTEYDGEVNEVDEVSGL